MPTSNLTSFGAIGDGVSNNDVAIAAAVASGNDIVVPAGNFLYAKSFSLPAGTTWEGSGFASNLIASGRNDTTYDSGAIILTGQGSRLLNLRRTYTGGGSRTDWEAGHAVLVRNASDFTIAGCFLHGASSAGLLIRASTRGKVTGNLVRDTLADGIHVTGDATPSRSSSQIDIHDNHVLNVGDDCIAVVSYLDHGENGANRQITIRGNQTAGGSARGITVIGGSHVIIAENVVSAPALAGVLIDAETSFNAYGGTDIAVVDNILIDTGSADYASIQVAGRAVQPFSDIVIRNNRLNGCRNAGIALLGTGAGTVVGVQVVGNRIDTVALNGLLAVNVNDLRCEANAISAVQQYGIFTSGGAGYLKVNDNVFTDVNKVKNPSGDVIQVSSGAPFVGIEMRNNLHRDPLGNGVERLIECFYDDVIAENNFGGPVTLGLLPVPDDRQRVRAASQTNSAGASLATLTGDFNSLLQRLRDAGLVAN